MKKVEKVSFYNRHRTALLVTSVIFVGIIFWGAVGYAGVSYRNNQQIKKQLKEATKRANNLELEKVKNQPSINSQADTTPTANAPSTNSTTRSTTPANTSTSSTPAPQYTPSPSCTSTYIPFKVFYKRGSSWPINGVEGITEVCTYSDGRPPVTTVRHPVIDEIRYINVYTADYATAEGICKSAEPAYKQACIDVVMQPN